MIVRDLRFENIVLLKYHLGREFLKNMNNFNANLNIKKKKSFEKGILEFL